MSNNQTKVYEYQTNSKILTQYGALTNEYSYVYLEGLPNNNLAGPLNMEFTMKSKKTWEQSIFKFNKLFSQTKPETPIDQKDIEINYILYIMPFISNDIKINMSHDYTYRKVNKNGSTPPESDDIISFIYGEPKEEKSITVLKKKDLRLNAYYIWDSKSQKYLSLDTESLCFTTTKDANEFKKWLLATKTIEENKKPKSQQLLKIGSKNISLKNQANQITNIKTGDILELIVVPNNIFTQQPQNPTPNYY